jgi:predicted nucleic acid-binding protein
MTDKVFIDSNVWVYLFSENENHKEEVAQTFLADSSTHSIFVTSCQVVNEVCNVLKRHGMAEKKLRVVIENLTNICVMQNLSKDVCMAASVLREKYSLSFWDSIIVATAKTAGCSRLISEDMHDGQVMDGLRIENIFLSDKT